MGITDFFSAAWDTFAQPSPDAEAPPQGGSSTESPASGTPEESKEEEDVNKADAKDDGDSGEQGHKPSSKPSDEDGDEGGDEGEEEGGDDAEEEEEEETVDPKEQLEEGTYHELKDVVACDDWWAVIERWDREFDWELFRRPGEWKKLD